jgi:adenosylcobinamide kinase/adenosylcobinamide-phosphate guanylyltransferase
VPGELVLVTGGARSGKSAFAERLAASYGRAVLYVATAQAGDAEMAARIVAHQARRPAAWQTVEAPLDPARAIRGLLDGPRVALLECLGLLASNVLHAEGDPERAAGQLHRLLDELIWLVAYADLHLVVVTSEVGLGFLPLTPVGRAYLDLLGDANQRLAQRARRTYLVVAGLAVDLRALAGEAGQP